MSSASSSGGRRALRARASSGVSVVRRTRRPASSRPQKTGLLRPRRRRGRRARDRRRLAGRYTRSGRRGGPSSMQVRPDRAGRERRQASGHVRTGSVPAVRLHARRPQVRPERQRPRPRGRGGSRSRDAISGFPGPPAARSGGRPVVDIPPADRRRQQVRSVSKSARHALSQSVRWSSTSAWSRRWAAPSVLPRRDALLPAAADAVGHRLVVELRVLAVSVVARLHEQRPRRPLHDDPVAAALAHGESPRTPAHVAQTCRTLCCERGVVPTVAYRVVAAQWQPGGPAPRG
jgi:hypothetical protein